MMYPNDEKRTHDHMIMVCKVVWNTALLYIRHKITDVVSLNLIKSWLVGSQKAYRGVRSKYSIWCSRQISLSLGLRSCDLIFKQKIEIILDN